jgi:hypothetical protein
MDRNNPDNPWPHTTDCMCRRCINPGRNPTLEELEGILQEETDPERRATAFAALTLMRLLAPDWKHVVRDGRGSHRTVLLPAGETTGPREELEERLRRLSWELR